MSNRKSAQAVDRDRNFSAFREELLGGPATGRLVPFPGEPRLLDYLLIAALLLAPIPIFVWIRERRLGARTRELRSVLDHADALEHELQECRARLREIPPLVSRLPPAISLSAHATLTAEPEVQAALHDLLQHRLWLKQFGADASLAELKAASAALVHSREKLALQLDRLDEVRKELASAGGDMEKTHS
ncbi:hypothetical protein SAMN05216289_10394 [Dokdonella immobilis]|uniref:Uncharacterized protein n=1 Tax=Dokdonella immobilis TaxID=578942 RepID=A0A1I4VVK9_9GAMM|nr:hypothetical protein SAMN05216289_10394 [Dokdonella immobilis]